MNNKTKLGLWGIVMAGALALSPKPAESATFGGVCNPCYDGTTANQCTTKVSVKPPKPNGYVYGFINNDIGQYVSYLHSGFFPLIPGRDTLVFEAWKNGYKVMNKFPVSELLVDYQNHDTHIKPITETGCTVNQPVEKLYWVPAGPMKGKIFWDDNIGDSLVVEVPDSAGIHKTNGIFDLAALVNPVENGKHYTIEITMPSQLPGYSAVTHGDVRLNQFGEAIKLPKLYFPSTNPGVKDNKERNLKNSISFQSICKNNCKTNYTGIVELYDVTGKQVGKRFIQNGNLNLVTLPAGVYHAKTPEGSYKITKIE